MGKRQGDVKNKCPECKGDGFILHAGPKKVDTLDDFGSTCNSQGFEAHDCQKCQGTGQKKTKARKTKA